LQWLIGQLQQSLKKTRATALASAANAEAAALAACIIAEILNSV
jgi:hypothetical protein